MDFQELALNLPGVMFRGRASCFTTNHKILQIIQLNLVELYNMLLTCHQIMKITQDKLNQNVRKRLIFGTLYPAYSSYKAVKSKDIKDYVKWMMYWIIFALFTTAETITDIFLSWIPFYYELKIAFVVWLLSPYTKGSSVLYRKFVHPTLTSKEKEIDDYLCQAKDKSYDALVHFGRKGLNVAATAAVTAAAKVSQLPEIIKYGDFKEVKGQGALSERLRSFSMQDLSTIQRDEAGPVPGPVPSKTPTAQPRSRTIARSKSENTSGMLLLLEVIFIFTS
ncbi:REEP1 protein, partial [Polyodon spathula]|nr:REEP1 protein [Polyodon spathula]